MVVINSETFIEYEIKNEGFKDFLMKLSLLTKGSWKHCAFGTPSENFIADLPFHYCLFPHRGSSQIIAKANLSQTCKKSGTWEPGSRTFLKKNPDIFQK